MQVIEIRGKPKSFNGSFNVRLDVRRGIGNGAVPKYVESALGSNCDAGFSLIYAAARTQGASRRNMTRSKAMRDLYGTY